MRYLKYLLLALPLQAVATDDTFSVVAPFEIIGPDPETSGAIFQRMGLTETLVDVDASGKLLPGLALSWQASEDGLSWDFTLRDGVLFHDGSALTAKAAAASLQRTLDQQGLLKKTPITAISAEGQAVRVILSEPFSALPAFLAENRTVILAPSAYDAEGKVLSVIGTGPFALTGFEPPLRLDAERNKAYWGEAPAISAVQYSAVSRAETRALMAESGDADLAYNLDPSAVKQLADNEQVAVNTVALPRVLLLKLNNSLPFFDTPEERHALSMAVDRVALAEAVLRYPSAANQFFPPGMGEWHIDGIEGLTYDVEAAKAAFAKAGWTPGEDGVLTQDGVRFEVELLTYPDRPELPLTAAVLEQMLAEVGIKVTINSTNFSEIPAKSGNGELNMALFARNFALVPDPIGTLLQDYAPTGDWGAMAWDNPTFTAGVKALAREDDGSVERAKLAGILQAELPVVPLAWYQQNAAVSRQVEGFALDPFERTFALEDIDVK